jgi:methylenetetrahydrofolate reductase (NADPH)
MFDFPYIIELLTPKKTDDPYPERLLNRFGERFKRSMQAGCAVSIPDNPMGNLRMGALETIQLLGLSFDPEQLVINLNTFHHKDELDEIIETALRTGVRFLLVVRGDGGPALSRIEPTSIGGRFNVASSADLIDYINRAYPDKFVTGAAFNHYNPIEVELKRLDKKIGAGARYIVTQPVIGSDSRLNQLRDRDIPLVIEAWMSHNIELFSQSVGDDTLSVADYDPVDNLKLLHDTFPDSCIYLSMLNFSDSFEEQLPAFLAG